MPFALAFDYFCPKFNVTADAAFPLHSSPPGKNGPAAANDLSFP
jgi:hypothetical protein